MNSNSDSSTLLAFSLKEVESAPSALESAPSALTWWATDTGNVSLLVADPQLTPCLLLTLMASSPVTCHISTLLLVNRFYVKFSKIFSYFPRVYNFRKQLISNYWQVFFLFLFFFFHFPQHSFLGISGMTMQRSWGAIWWIFLTEKIWGSTF